MRSFSAPLRTALTGTFLGIALVAGGAGAAAAAPSTPGGVVALSVGMCTPPPSPTTAPPGRTPHTTEPTVAPTAPPSTVPEPAVLPASPGGVVGAGLAPLAQRPAPVPSLAAHPAGHASPGDSHHPSRLRRAIFDTSTLTAAQRRWLITSMVLMTVVLILAARARRRARQRRG